MTDEVLFNSVPFTKFNDEEQIVYGWASVSTVDGEPLIDRQGDYIPIDVLEKATTEFMEQNRDGHTMHEGVVTGRVVHSMPISKEIAQALGIHTDREGWIVGYKVYDEKSWDRVKRGELKAFSIGGHARSEEYHA